MAADEMIVAEVRGVLRLTHRMPVPDVRLAVYAVPVLILRRHPRESEGRGLAVVARLYDEPRRFREQTRPSAGDRIARAEPAHGREAKPVRERAVGVARIA